MSTLYFIACHDCKESRDLDKFYGIHDAKNRQELEAFSGEIKEHHSYRSALAMSFLWRHKGHNCSLHTEDDLPNGYIEDVGFW